MLIRLPKSTPAFVRFEQRWRPVWLSGVVTTEATRGDDGLFSFKLSTPTGKVSALVDEQDVPREGYTPPALLAELREVRALQTIRLDDEDPDMDLTEVLDFAPLWRGDEEGVVLVRSDTDPDKSYRVLLGPEGQPVGCNCHHWTYRRSARTCKHQRRAALVTHWEQSIEVFADVGFEAPWIERAWRQELKKTRGLPEGALRGLRRLAKAYEAMFAKEAS